MPKVKNHLSEMQKQQQTKTIVKAAYPPSKVEIKVLGTGVNGAPRSLYIFTDLKCYLFNCGEGTQRIAHENKFKITKVENIFSTRTSWANVGGLPGMALTIQDVGIPKDIVVELEGAAGLELERQDKRVGIDRRPSRAPEPGKAVGPLEENEHCTSMPIINIHGASGLNELFSAASKFVNLKHLKVCHIDATAPNAVFEDSVMKVEYIPIMPPLNETANCDGKTDSFNYNASRIEKDDAVNYYDKDNIPDAKRARIDQSVPVSGQVIPNQRRNLATINYLCRLHPKKGSLLTGKCAELGVPKGPLFGKLKNGHDVTLEDGRIVKANDVRTPDEPGPVFLVVECPDNSYLDAFVNEPRLATNLHAADPLESPQVIVHFTPSEIIDHPKYKAWMDGFRSDITHLKIGPSMTAKRGFGSVGVHRFQHQLHLVDSEIFPLLNIDMPLKGDHQNDEECQAGLTFYLQPNKKLCYDFIPRLNVKEYVDETLAIPGLAAAIESLKISKSEAIPISDRKYPKVTFLGTGSAIPNKTRNTSAILVETSPDCFILLDCGEGTYGQIVRFYGTERATKILSCLKAVYISHLHADHHIGLIGLLFGRKSSLAAAGMTYSQIKLIAPHQINDWLTRYDLHFESILCEFQFIGCASLKANQPPNLELLSHLSLSSFLTDDVIHCLDSFGMALTTLEGFKLTYSGDTIGSLIDLRASPTSISCSKLIELGRNSDLLIHEATMEDAMEAEAKKKRHSTVSQAIEVGRSMGAKFTLLTHFSQRYSRIPYFGDGAAEKRTVGVAFDHMTVTPDQFHRLPSFIPVLKLMFSDHHNEMDKRTAKVLKATKECISTGGKSNENSS